jgi:hypothetical protein
LFPKDTTENCDNIKALFKDIERILNQNGRYVAISLLQAHILRELLAYFTPKNYEITITEFLIKKSKLFPYLISVTKSANPNNNRITLSLKNENNEKVVLNSVQAQQKIKETQTYSLFMSDIGNLRQGQRVSIDIWDEKRRGDTNVPRYTLILCDSPDARILSQVPYFLIFTVFKQPNRNHVDVSSLHKEENPAGSLVPSPETLSSYHSKSASLTSWLNSI